MKNIPFFFVLFFAKILFAQTAVPDRGQVFVDSLVPRVDILISPDSLAAIYADVWSDKEYLATFIFDNQVVRDTMYNVGFRLRGNTSRNAAKKSFRVSFNSFVTGRKYHGLEKMNLNGEHNDPCVIRAKIGWDMLRKVALPAPRSNHVEVYINNTYYGLYINVEHIDENFIKKRFGDNDGNMYKCLYPADLAYLGQNPDLYKFVDNGRRAYEQTINEDIDDYSDFSHFIDVLNNTQSTNFACELEKVFNVNDYLEYMAFDVLDGNWDGSIYNKNNFYLYHNLKTGQFEYLPYDIDNTLGIDWLGKDWGTRNIYTWKPSDASESRPLYSKLLANPLYKDRFSYFLQKWTQTAFKESALFPHIDSIFALISPYAQTDSFRTLDYNYSFADFQNAYAQALGNQVAYGLKPYITTRRNNAISQLQNNDITPIIRKVFVKQKVDTLFYHFKAEDNQNILATEMYINPNNTGFQSLPLFDDGLHQDEQANDGVFGGFWLIPAGNTSFQYFITATDNLGKMGRYPYCDNMLFPQTTAILPPKMSLFFAYPNPFTSELTLTMPDEINSGNILIFNDLGQIIFKEKVNNARLIYTENWANGLYLVKMEAGDKVWTTKVLK